VCALGLFLIYTYNNRPPQIIVPTHAVPADNGWNYIHQAYLLAKAMKHKSPYDMTGTAEQDFTIANLRGCANNAKPALALMNEALKHPFICPPIRSDKDFLTQMNRNPEPRGLARVNAGAADYYAATGDPGRAMKMRLNGLEMGVLLPRGGVTMDDGVGSACDSISLHGAEPLIPLLDANQLRVSAQRLDRIAGERVPFSEVFIEDGYSETAMIQEMLRNPKFGPPGNEVTGVRALAQLADWDPGLEHAGRMRTAIAEATFVVASKSNMLRKNFDWYRAVAQESEKPFAGKSNVPVPGIVFAKSAAEVLDFERVNHFATDAEIAVLRVEIALYKYRAANHCFPSALSELSPQYLQTVPMDPFGGGPNKPLRYRLNPDGRFLLYSLGPDLTDNGGTPGKYYNSVPGDIVAGKLYSNKPILPTGAAKKH
jgi:hypothetical protein